MKQEAELCQFAYNHTGEIRPPATVTIFLGGDDLFDALDLSGLPASGAQAKVCQRCADLYNRGDKPTVQK